VLTLISRFLTKNISIADCFRNITWEDTEVIIKDKDGSVKFQRKVEFPQSWSQTARTITANKYFTDYEYSLHQLLTRIVMALDGAGQKQGVIDNIDLATELYYLLGHQYLSFNSPVYFNVGVEGRRQQCAACFLLHVDDHMESILDWIKTEGFVFKGGSGSGVNISKLRAEGEAIRPKGVSSGPLSFMAAADCVSGVIKSGSVARRAAKMVLMDTKHPDIEKFINCKIEAEVVLRKFMAMGYDIDVNSNLLSFIPYQNANNSVIVSDEFMEAVLYDKDWHTRYITTGDVCKTYKAKDLFNQICEAAYVCADPGLWYEDTINQWHTCKDSGPIRTVNPCHRGRDIMLGSKGPITIEEAIKLNINAALDGKGNVAPITDWINNGIKSVYEVKLLNGLVVGVTEDHKFVMEDNSEKAVKDLQVGDKLLPLPPVKFIDVPLSEHLKIPEFRYSTQIEQFDQLPKKWTPDVGYFLGHLLGNGFISDKRNAWKDYHVVHLNVTQKWGEKALTILKNLSPTTVYSSNKKSELSPEFETQSISFIRWLQCLGVNTTDQPKQIPFSIWTAPNDVKIAYLAGWYDADGDRTFKYNKVPRLTIKTYELAQEAWLLLKSVGIDAFIRETEYDTEFIQSNGVTKSYKGKAYIVHWQLYNNELRSIFSKDSLAIQPVDYQRERTKTALTEQLTTVESITYIGEEEVYDFTVPTDYRFLTPVGVSVDCGEYLFLDYTSCNLASLNLMKFLNKNADTDEWTFDVDLFIHAVEVLTTAMDIIVDYADYPTEKIATETRKYRTLGIGYSNLGAMLMVLGLPYDSDEGRDVAASITSLMTAAAYHHSSVIADKVGSFSEFPNNADSFKSVMHQHVRAHTALVLKSNVSTLNNLSHVQNTASQLWNKVLDKDKFRNAQVTLIAPTGCQRPDSLVVTSEGILKLEELGDTQGSKWQPLAIKVSQENTNVEATRFYNNGKASTKKITLQSGIELECTFQHKYRVVRDNQYMWCSADMLELGDVLPVPLGTYNKQTDPPLLSVKKWYLTERLCKMPVEVTKDLAWFLGVFFGDGNLNKYGISIACNDSFPDVYNRIAEVGELLFGIKPLIEFNNKGCASVRFNSRTLLRWIYVNGFDKPASRNMSLPAVIRCFSRENLNSFIQGYAFADGSKSSNAGGWHIDTASKVFSQELAIVMRSLGYDTSIRISSYPGMAGKYSTTVMYRISTPGVRRRSNVLSTKEHLPVRALLDSLGYNNCAIDKVSLIEDSECNTCDIEVPENNTYIANSVISHNTISFFMDCDTTGVEPELALVKYKTLVGGGKLEQINGNVPLALATLGYDTEIPKIINHIKEVGTIEGCSLVNAQDLPVFDCSFQAGNGVRSIRPMAHVEMVAAIQPFLSGGISKTCNLPTEATAADIADVYIQAWKLGVKDISVYRDGCKVAQPVKTQGSSIDSQDHFVAAPSTAARKRLPDTRNSLTHKFSISGHEGYLTVGLYDDGAPGEIFVHMSKEGSSISGLIDAFATAVSIGLQYGVPLDNLIEKFKYSRFEPSGFTGNADVPMATSVVDYIFKWLEHMMQASAKKLIENTIKSIDVPDGTYINGEVKETGDACPVCGGILIRTGTCEVCNTCGSQSGCTG
jgi:ribonucleoside-diphosphate reductase alpha chain